MSGHPHSSYAYTSNTNRLASVTDNAPLSGRAHGFNPGAGGGYTYDATPCVAT